MSGSSVELLITGSISVLGASILVILGSVLTISVGLLVFYFGWRKLQSVAGSPTYGENGWSQNGVYHPYTKRSSKKSNFPRTKHFQRDFKNFD
jgi:uncharacterized membrane protein